jgi:hypothetical protein
MHKIFILKKSKFITGPFSLEQLKETGIKASDKIWYEGLTDWQPASLLLPDGIDILSATTEAEHKPRSMMFWKKPSPPKS